MPILYGKNLINETERQINCITSVIYREKLEKKKMTQYLSPKSFEINCQWGPRSATPEELASRFLFTIDELRTIDPQFDGWNWLDFAEYARTPDGDEDEDISRFSIPFWKARTCLSKYIEECTDRTETSGKPTPAEGYDMGVSNNQPPGRKECSLIINDGNQFEAGAFARNSAELTIADDDYISNPLVRFEPFRQATLLLVEVWRASCAKVYPETFYEKVPDWDGMRPGWGWMTYLSPTLAELITPPRGIFVEYRPNGGLLLSATEELFDPDNARHYAGARAIRDALRPITNREDLYELPYE